MQVYPFIWHYRTARPAGPPSVLTCPIYLGYLSLPTAGGSEFFTIGVNIKPWTDVHRVINPPTAWRCRQIRSRKAKAKIWFCISVNNFDYNQQPNRETLHGGVFHAESPYFASRSHLVANISAVSISITSVLFTIRFSISQSDFRLA